MQKPETTSNKFIDEANRILTSSGGLDDITSRRLHRGSEQLKKADAIEGYALDIILAALERDLDSMHSAFRKAELLKLNDFNVLSNYMISLSVTGNIEAALVPLQRLYATYSDDPALLKELAELAFDSGRLSLCSGIFDQLSRIGGEYEWLELALSDIANVAPASFGDDEFSSYMEVAYSIVANRGTVIQGDRRYRFDNTIFLEQIVAVSPDTAADMNWELAEKFAESGFIPFPSDLINISFVGGLA